MRSLFTSAVTLKQVKVFLLEVDNIDHRTGLLKEFIILALQQEGAVSLADHACKVLML